MKEYSDLVFNPVAYAEVCKKQDEKSRQNPQKNKAHNSFGCYYDSRIAYGKLWNSVQDYRKSKDWG